MNTEYKEDIDLADEEIRKTLYYLDTNMEVLYMSHNIPQFRNLPNSKIENDRMCDYFVREHHDNMINFNTGACGIDYPEQDFFLNQLAYLIHKGTIVTEKDKISYFLNKVISANWALKKGDIVLSENGTIRKISDTSNNRQIKGILNYIIDNLYSDVEQYLQSSFDTLEDLKAIRSTENLRENYYPVVHAQWKYDKNGVFWCSRCECIPATKSDFCPNCGAKMDGDEHER